MEIGCIERGKGIAGCGLKSGGIAEREVVACTTPFTTTEGREEHSGACLTSVIPRVLCG
jgi:hypothetical protein